ncbi:Or13a.2 family protein [Megaselia abdita]
MFSTDSVLGFYTTYACGQFEFLQKDALKIIPNGYDAIMKSIGSLNNRKLKEELVQEEYCRRLRLVISRYNVLIKFCYLVNKLMSPMLFVNIAVSQFLICAVLFQVVSMGKNFNLNVIKFSVYIASALQQLFIICWNGENLIQVSHKTALTFYFCNWEGYNYVDIYDGINDTTSSNNSDTIIPVKSKKKNKNNKNAAKKKEEEGGGNKRAISYYPAGAKFNKMLLFTIKRSQKQLESTAYKFTLSLKNFTAVCIFLILPFLY